MYLEIHSVEGKISDIIIVNTVNSYKKFNKDKIVFTVTIQMLILLEQSIMVQILFFY